MLTYLKFSDRQCLQRKKSKRHSSRLPFSGFGIGMGACYFNLLAPPHWCPWKGLYFSETLTEIAHFNSERSCCQDRAQLGLCYPNMLPVLLRSTQTYVYRPYFLLLQIGKCTALEILSLRDNHIRRIPPEVGNCVDLHVLDLAGNRCVFLVFRAFHLSVEPNLGLEMSILILMPSCFSTKPV